MCFHSKTHTYKVKAHALRVHVPQNGWSLSHIFLCVCVFLRDEYARDYVILYFTCNYVHLHILPQCLCIQVHLLQTI